MLCQSQGAQALVRMNQRFELSRWQTLPICQYLMAFSAELSSHVSIPCSGKLSRAQLSLLLLVSGSWCVT